MSNTIRATSMTSSSRKPAPAVDLGMPPLKKALLRFFGFGLGGIILGEMLVGAGHGPTFLVIIGALPWLCLMLFLGIRLVLLLSTGGGVGYRRVKAAITAGEVDVTYFVRGEDHLLVVDEPRRLLCLNGEMLRFDNVKQLTTGTVGLEQRLIILLNSGANPLRHITLNARNLELAYARLGNSLGFA